LRGTFSIRKAQGSEPLLRIKKGRYKKKIITKKYLVSIFLIPRPGGIQHFADSPADRPYRHLNDA